MRSAPQVSSTERIESGPACSPAWATRCNPASPAASKWRRKGSLGKRASLPESPIATTPRPLPASAPSRVPAGEPRPDVAPHVRDQPHHHPEPPLALDDGFGERVEHLAAVGAVGKMGGDGGGGLAVDPVLQRLRGGE